MRFYIIKFVHILVILHGILDRILEDLGGKSNFFSTLRESFSMTSDPISKSVGVFNIYASRAVVCTVFHYHPRKTSISFFAMKNRQSEILTLSSPTYLAPNNRCVHHCLYIVTKKFIFYFRLLPVVLATSFQFSCKRMDLSYI